MTLGRRFGGILFAAASLAAFLAAAPSAAAAQPIWPSEARRIIERQVRAAADALKRRDMARLSRLVHPSEGLRFSSSVFVQPKTDRVFTPAQVRQLMRDKTRYVWGTADGSGDLIRQSYAPYHKAFVYDKDYARAKEINYNTFKRRGNTTNNIRAAYPNAIAVEFHVPGTGRERDFNWGSLWLIFLQKGASWYLVGVAHDSWAI